MLKSFAVTTVLVIALVAAPLPASADNGVPRPAIKAASGSAPANFWCAFLRICS